MIGVFVSTPTQKILDTGYDSMYVYEEGVLPHPCYPCTACFAKRNRPCWLERLEIFIGLKKGAQQQSITYAECYEEIKHFARRKRSSMDGHVLISY